MVDVGGKAPSERIAKAEGYVLICSQAADAIRENTVKKGDVLATARIAAIMAAKKTHELIPLCHPLKITSINVDLELCDSDQLPDDVKRKEPQAVHIVATVKAHDKTGVEMEALTAVHVAALTVYDMLKAIDKSIAVSSVRLVEKKGGKSGDYLAPNRDM